MKVTVALSGCIVDHCTTPGAVLADGHVMAAGALQSTARAFTCGNAGRGRGAYKHKRRRSF